MAAKFMKKPYEHIKYFFGLLFIFLLACPSEVKSADIIFRPQWILNDQHAGEIYAYEKMNQSNSNVKIILLPYDETKDQYQDVLSGKINVSTADIITLLNRIDKEHSDIVIFSFKEQISPAGYLSLKNKHIEKPKDLEGKIFGFYNETNRNDLKWFFDLHGIDFNNIKLKKITSDNLVPLIDEEVDVIVAHDTNEPIILKKLGYDTNFIPMYGPAHVYYGSAYFTTRSFYKRNKKSLSEFVRKISEGWKWAIEHPDEAADMVMKYYPRSRYIMNSYNITKEKVVKGINVRAFHLTYNVGMNCIGCMTKMQWNIGINELIKNDLIQNKEMLLKVADFDITRDVFLNKN